MLNKLWSSVTGQPAAARFLRNALSAGRLPGLLLFAGPRGVGKRTAARVFVAAALCESGEGPEGNVTEACGACRSCRELAAGVHADLVLPKVMVPTEGKRCGKPDFRPLTDEDRMITLVKTVRPLLEDIRLRSARGGRRVALLRRAERMNEESQNTLLKSLEEPVGALVWALTSDDPARLLGTVRSRATKVRFGRVPAALVAKRLTEGLTGHDPLTPERAGEVALASEGSFARAVEILSGGWQDDREFVESEVVSELGAGPPAGPALARKLVRRAKSTAREAGGADKDLSRLEATRRSALRLVEILARALRDRLRERAGASPEESTPWAEALKVVLDSEAALRQNVRIELALSVVGLRLARAGC